MFRLAAWLLRWAALLALIGLCAAAVRAGAAKLAIASGWTGLLESPAFYAGVGGLALRMLLTRWRKRDPLEFVDTLEHELTHALAGALTLAPPVSLKATLRKGGEVELKRNNPVAALAPYFLPLYASFASVLTLVLEPGLLAYGKIVVGLLLGSFAYRLGRELHLGQTDLREYGLIFSFGFIGAMLPLWLGVLLETARILDLPWKAGIWPLFLAQGRWAWEAAIRLGFKTPG
jgi:hypothetical protein